MEKIHSEISRFHARKCRRTEQASQRAAFFIVSGVDLDAALALRGQERRRMLCRVERLLERERLKGTRRHWSYDLNRHIALKNALDVLRAVLEQRANSGKPPSVEQEALQAIETGHRA